MQEPPAEPDIHLSPLLNRMAENPHRVHLMGICGTGMASLAGMLQEKGYEVTGSDQNVYPPMSQLLENLAIPVLKGYNPANLHPSPDLVIVGNVITRDNPEAVELARLNLPYLSLPQALTQFAMSGKRSVVICGTHGKTTTAALTAWILERAGLDAGFMIGGIPRNFQKNFKLGAGPYFVVEGDEYDTAFFDKGPKFLHYNPWATILTGIEFDHADIYRDLDHVVASFRRLITVIPPEGLLVANMDNPVVAREIGAAKSRIAAYSLSDRGGWFAHHVRFDQDLTRLTVFREGKEYLKLACPLYGTHNVSNLLSAVVLAHELGIPPRIIAKASESFRGVARRQDTVGERKGILVLDDFAHHPTAVSETVRAVREKYKGRRLVAVFEPRSNSSRRNIFQDRYAEAFDHADLVMVPEPSRVEKIPVSERFSAKRLAEDLSRRRIPAFSFQDTGTLLQALLQEAKEGDVILIMSNGGFDNLHNRFLDSL